MTLTHDEITKTLTSDKTLKNIHQRALFHYFNPHGAVAHVRKAEAEIRDAVDSGEIKSGTLLVYGSLNSYHVDELRKQAMRKWPTSVWKVQYHVDALYEKAKKARHYLVTGEVT